MQTPTLHNFQRDAIEQIRASVRAGSRRPLLVAPTGAGKTVMFCSITANFHSAGKTVYILVHRQELITQTSGMLHRYGIPHGIIDPKSHYDPEQLVHVCSVQTLVRRLKNHKAPDLIIVDEAHHAVAGTWRKILDASTGSLVLGVTATPERLDGAGLKDVFDDLIRGPEAADLIQEGFLSKPEYWSHPSMDMTGKRIVMGDFRVSDLEAALTKRVIGDAVETYRAKADKMPAVAFCPTLAKARAVASDFCAVGYKFAVIDGTLTREERKTMVDQLADGTLDGLCSCEIISEGFDLPTIGCAILLRPTQSVAIHLQQIGRALRTYPGKQKAVILDHAGNLRRHGLVEDFRDWSLEGGVAKKQTKSTIRECPKCHAVVRISVMECSECGFDFTPKAKPIIAPVKGELQQIQASEQKPIGNPNQEAARAGSLEELQAIARKYGYKQGWAWHRWNAKRQPIESPKFKYAF